MSKIVVLGQGSFVLPFKAVGAVTRTVANREEALTALDEIRQSSEPVVLLASQKVGETCREELGELRDAGRAVVLVLSTQKDVASPYYADLKELVTRAAGVDLLARTSTEKE